MYFHSFEYIFIFLPITWFLYLLLRNTFLKPILLIFSGYFFYAWGRPWIASLLFLSSTVDFLIGLNLEHANTPHKRRLLLIFSLVFNLGLLAIFKYSAWIFGGINGVLSSHHIAYQLPILHIALPPGISFYTFQSLAYIIDIYRRKIHAHRNIVEYYAFVAFFPQLFAGPIERAGHLLPQIVHTVKRIHPRMIEMGIFMIIWGLFKKLVVADNMANIIELSTQNSSLPSAKIIVLLAFTFQIYADFSGYTDIARGSAKLFGIKLRRNFLTPYFSSNPSEFWQRWHISLSAWIREYIYISLGGNRKGKLHTIFNLFITMFLAGLWHGAGKYFLLWGIYHGVLLILYRFIPFDIWLERYFAKLGMVLAKILMFTFIVIGWGLFYAGSHNGLSAMFLSKEVVTTSLSIGVLWYGWFIFALPIILTDLLAYIKHREFSDLWPHFHLITKTTILVIIFYGIIFLGARDSHEFIYFQF